MVIPGAKRETDWKRRALQRRARRRVEREGKSWTGVLCGAHEKKETERNERSRREKERERKEEGETDGRGRGGEIEAPTNARGVETGGGSWQGDGGIGRKQQQFPLSGAADCYHEKQASTLIF